VRSSVRRSTKLSLVRGAGSAGGASAGGVLVGEDDVETYAHVVPVVVVWVVP